MLGFITPTSQDEEYTDQLRAPGAGEGLVFEDEARGGQRVEDARPHGHDARRDLGQVVEGPERDKAGRRGRQRRHRGRISGGRVAQEAARQPHQLLHKALPRVERVGHRVRQPEVHSAQTRRVGIAYPRHLHQCAHLISL